MPSVLDAGRLASRRLVQLCALLSLFVLYIVQLTGAVLPNVPALAVGALGGLALDILLQYKRPGLLALLGKARFDAIVRQLFRDMLLLLGLLRIDGVEPLGEQAPLTVTLFTVYLAHFACQAAAVLVRRSRTLPVLTRNIDTGPLALCAAPPRILSRRPGHRLLTFSAPATVGLALTAGTTDAVWGALGVGLSLALMAGGTAYLATWLFPGKRPAGDDKVMAWLESWLEEYRPETALYFSGGASSAYQANMWLETVAAQERPLIVLRERFMMQKIDATEVPVICFPKVATMFCLEASTLKVMLHPANSGKTSQVLRIPSIKHAFTNHGESDKLSSCNPYAKAYDEVWVAGPAARQRYADADVGVEDKDIVEVGRPQLAPIKPYQGAPTGQFTTVLYAPTWEGWDGNPGNTSVVLAGENVVRALLADERVRLLYKPHPMTGSVDPRAGAANERIMAMVREANTRRSGERPGAEAVAEIDRRSAELDRLTSTSFRTSADDVERMMLQGPTPGGGSREAAVREATELWNRAYWDSFPEWEHQVVTGPRPAIFACFNEADLLISDVSSVVSDWLDSEKPYAVANTSGLTEANFRSVFPTVGAAFVLGPEAEEVPALLRSVREPAEDAYAEARRELKEHLLGPADPPSPVRFAGAVRALAALADERAARMAGQPAASASESGGPELVDEPAEAADPDVAAQAAETGAESDAVGAQG